MDKLRKMLTFQQDMEDPSELRLLGIQDLAPHAEARGHRVIYASFWQAPLSPLAVLLHALARISHTYRTASASGGC